MNIVGINDQIEYIDNHGDQRIAKLDYISGNPDPFEPGIRDPQWLVSVPPGGDFQGPYDWLRYLGTDGNNWKTYVHAEEEGIMFKIWSESTRTYSQDDDGERDGDNPTFQFVDWNGVKWNVDFYQSNSPALPDPHPVRFSLSKV